VSPRTLRVLVSGAGVAGSAATLALAADGHAITLIERVPAFGATGYGLSLKYFGLWVMKQLGVLDALQSRAIPVDRIVSYDRHGATLHEYSGPLMSDAVRGSLMMNRADLHDVLFGAAARHVTPRFGTTIAGADDTASGVRVAFSDGTTGVFDLVVVAEGLRSATREMRWGSAGFQPFEIVYAAARLEHGGSFEVGRMELYLDAGKSFMLTPSSPTHALMQGYFRGRSSDGRGERSIRDHLLDTYRDYPVRLTGMIASLGPDETLFADDIAMITLPTLVKGRVVLLGDAGYCPTFLSGMGASLGAIGASALAQSLRRSADDLSAALARYDAVMRPLIVHFQANAHSNVAMLLSPDPWRSELRNLAIRALPEGWVLKGVRREYEVESGLLREIMGDVT
jgi:2-polyprenyl-6-methoxyphenol hydroxylase-like FAD-dependent oxidoreductase